MADDPTIESGQTAETPAAEPKGEDAPSLRDTIAEAYAEQLDKADAKAKGEGEAEPRARPPKDASGRFQARQGAREPAGGKSPQAGAAGAPGPATGQQTAPSGPPVGWSAQSKADFAKLPAHVQADVVKREGEISVGLARLGEYKGIDRFVDMARQSGTTLEAALGQYTGIENILRRDPAAGLIEVMRNVPMAPAVLLGEVVRRLGGVPTGGAPSGGFAPQGAQVPPYVQNEINELRNFMLETRRERDEGNLRMAQSTVADFWDDPRHPHAEEVAPYMVMLTNTAREQGQRIDLEKIYETACYMHPQVRELLISEQYAPRSASEAGKQAAAAASARSAARATIGAPAAGFTPAKGAPNPNESLRDAVQAAYEEVLNR